MLQRRHETIYSVHFEDIRLIELAMRESSSSRSQGRRRETVASPTRPGIGPSWAILGHLCVTAGGPFFLRRALTYDTYEMTCKSTPKSYCMICLFTHIPCILLCLSQCCRRQVAAPVTAPAAAAASAPAYPGRQEQSAAVIAITPWSRLPVRTPCRRSWLLWDRLTEQLGRTVAVAMSFGLLDLCRAR